MSWFVLSQLIIGVFGSISFALAFCDSIKRQKIGVVMAVLIIPFWYITIIVTQQWFTLPLHISQSCVWLYKFYKLFLKNKS